MHRGHSESPETLHVETGNGKDQNTDVANASGEKSKYLPFSVFQYEAPDNYGTGLRAASRASQGRRRTTRQTPVSPC